MSLFTLVVPDNAAHPSFKTLAEEPGYEAARWMMDDVLASFNDLDGNFVEQFQTAGFNQRTFELYLHAYLTRSGFTLSADHGVPDFIATAGDHTVAIEATTVNPPTSGVLAEFGKSIAELSEAEMVEYQRHELAIRFGSPLFSKLKKAYWKLPHCEGRPLVIAIQAFHDEQSLGLSDSALSGYLYGITSTSSVDEAGELSVAFDRIYEHVLEGKTVPSSFFDQPDAEHVSAVLFSNVGTVAKFSRMGFQAGIANDTTLMMRQGYSLNHSPNAQDPTFFNYSLDAPPHTEFWGESLVVMHNPQALRPLPVQFFPDAATHSWLDDKLWSESPSWHPFASKTVHIHMGEHKQKLIEAVPTLGAPVAVGAIDKADFQALTGHPGPGPVATEEGWFSDESSSFLGVVMRDHADNDWSWVLLARDQFFRFRAIDVDSSIPTRKGAVRALQHRIAVLASAPQRVFPQ